VFRAAFSPDGKTLATTGAEADGPKLWTSPRASYGGRWSRDRHSPGACSSCPTATLVTSGYDRTVRFWDVTAQREKRKWVQPVNLTTLAASADGSLLAAAEHPGPGEGPAQLLGWEVATGKVLLELKDTVAESSA